MSKYKMKLYHSMEKLTKIYILIFVMIFIIILIISMFITQVQKNERVIQDYTKILDTIFTSFEENISFHNHNNNLLAYLAHPENEEKVFQTYYHYKSSVPIECEMLLFDDQGHLIFSSTGDMHSVRKTPNFNRDELKEGEYITSTIREKEEKSKLVLTTGVFQNNVLKGYVSYYYDPNSLNYELSLLEDKGSIIDKFGNVIATSTPEYISGYLKRLDHGLDSSGYHIRNGDLLRIQVKGYKDGIQIVSIVSFLDYLVLYRSAILFILLFSLATYLISKRNIMMLAKSNSSSIDKLVEQMEIIKKGDIDHLVTIDTDDEFQMLSKDINNVVVAIEKVGRRNGELYYLNKISEMKRLEAQFNPHFLYNTLETIRSAVLFDAKAVDRLILKLTSILRYSMDNSISQVYFIDDLEIIQEYLDIQNYRYKDRLQVTFDIQEECENQIIPRLMIEPLLENSIKNGFRYHQTLCIHVKAYIEDDKMYVSVQDNGNGIAQDKLEEIHYNLESDQNQMNHHGLYNLNRQLSLMYGIDSKLRIESVLGEGTTVTVCIHLKGAKYHV